MTQEHTDIHRALQETYGYLDFRGNQEEIIRHTLAGNDSLVIMPTGGGKSMCYQIPAIVSLGITIVISPLIALMNDQVLALKSVGVNAASLHSHIDAMEQKMIMHESKSGKVQILYLSPERMNTREMQYFLSSLNINTIAIDEAHCVSIWGNDFRPDYVKLAHLKSTFPGVPIIALTATADKATQKDIVDQLNLDAKVFISSFERTNITTYAYPGQKRIEQIADILDQQEDESGIIYCLSRKDTERVSQKLNEMGFQAEFYHAGVAKEERLRIQNAFQNDKINIICATIAFGMGIDKPNIKFVIHYNMPKNIESYYQEIGRAGRDGRESEAHMFYSWGDFLNLKRFIDRSEAVDTFKEVQYAKLNRMWEYASTTDCRTNGILAYFGEYKSTPCGHCDNCLYPPKKIDGTEIAQKALSAMYRSNFQVSQDTLIDILRGSQKAEIREKGYDQIKTFGAGRDIPRSMWRSYLIQLINKGVIGIDYTQQSRLVWTPLSKPIIQGKQQVMLSKYQDINRDKVEKKDALLNEPVDKSLLSELKDWRKDRAAEMNVPSYIIFGNKVLEDISASKPSTLKELLKINGIGKVKLEKFGDEVIRIVKQH